MTQDPASVRPVVSDRLAERVDELLRELCSIPSPSGSEGEVRDRVAAIAAGAGFAERYIDDAGNLWLSRSDSAAGPRTVLCGHFDTVEHTGIEIVPVLVDDGWENANEAILGADNKAALAVMLAAAEELSRVRPDLLHAVELLFTTGEEQALEGAKQLDPERLRDANVFIYDHATPIGQVIAAAPSYFRIDATFEGKAAHAGISPEHGRSAVRAAARAVASMPHGRLDAGTTANAARVDGGALAGTNIVPARCDVRCEVRSLDPARATEVVQQVTDAFQDAAGQPGEECDLVITTELQFAAYRHEPKSPLVARVSEALDRCGHGVRLIESGGGSDANALMAMGVPAICVANGTEHPHEPTERVSRSALRDMTAFTLALLGA